MSFRSKKRSDGTRYAYPIQSASGPGKGKKALAKNLHGIKVKVPENQKNVKVEETEPEVNIEEQEPFDSKEQEPTDVKEESPAQGKAQGAKEESETEPGS
jgi:hypothetical protein